nr:DUF1016 N-terminal domain-containing protein [Rathayibacter iranicus]
MRIFSSLVKKVREFGGAVLLHQREVRGEFPSMKGFSRANIFYMRRFAAAWPDENAIVQRPVGLLPWGHITELLDL